MEFDGPPDALVPPDFVTDVGQNKMPPSRKDSPAKHGWPSWGAAQ